MIRSALHCRGGVRSPFPSSPRSRSAPHFWVVYLSGYAAIHARIAFLMGSDRRAVDDAILVLRETHERARDSFDLSMSTPTPLRLRARLHQPSVVHVDPRDRRLRRPLCRRRRLQEPRGWAPQPVDQPVRHGGTTALVGPAAGEGPQPGCRRVLGVAASVLAGGRRRRAAAAQRAGRAGRAARTSAFGARASRVRPAAQTPTRPRALRGWVYKTPSSQGPLRRPPSRPTHRRFLVLRAQRLEIFASQDRADLSPAYAPSRVIELAEYAVRSVHAEEPYTLALQPKEGEEAALSWYLRLGDRSSFAEWEARLRLACQPAQQQAEDDEESDTSSSSEEGDDHGDDADGRDGAPRAAREEERTVRQPIPPPGTHQLDAVHPGWAGAGATRRRSSRLMCRVLFQTVSCQVKTNHLN